MRRTRVVPVLALLATAALAAGACGSSSSDTSSGVGAESPPTTTSPDTTAEAPAADTDAGGPLVAVADSSLGEILVDQSGLTLYLFTPDSPTESTCEGGCAAAWPPMDGPAEAGDGVDASKLGTITRPDGSTQVSYAGHPLYYYASDREPGDVEGQGLSGNWYVVDAAGEAVTADEPSGGGRSGGGY